SFLEVSASSSVSITHDDPVSLAAEIPAKIPSKKLTPRARHKAMRRRSIITVGTGDEEVKIYTIHWKDGYPAFQCAWYELRQRKTKTFASIDAAKLFAQQKVSSLRQEPTAANPASQRDFELIR